MKKNLRRAIVFMLDSNYLIINRKARRFSEMRIAGKAAVFIDANGVPLDYGVLVLDGSVYSGMYCDDVRNITFVIDKAGKQTVETLLWYTEEGYRNGFKALQEASGIRFTRQNLRINRYAESVAEKLSEGVRLRVTDEVDVSDMAVCPECGMLNPPGSQYCLDCGADMEG